MLHLNRPLVFLDLETTGTDVAKDRIVEIAFVKVLPDGSTLSIPANPSERYLINPEMEIPLEASLVHGIYNKDVALKPTFEQCAQELYDFIEGCDLGGFNSNRFDIPLLAEEFLRAGLFFSLDDRKTVDVQVLFHMLEPRNLGAAVRIFCGKELENAHSALADTQATYEVMLGMLKHYASRTKVVDEVEVPLLPNDVESLDKMSSYRKRADLVGNFVYNETGDMVFGFGKHKGQKVADVLQREPGYYSWMMNADFPLYTKEVLKKFRNALP